MKKILIMSILLAYAGLAMSNQPTNTADYQQLLLPGANDDQVQQGLTLLTAAAKQKDPVAQFQLAQIYEQGKLVAADNKQALSWYLQSADLGYNPAQLYLAQAYEQGSDLVNQDSAKSLAWYLKAPC